MADKRLELGIQTVRLASSHWEAAVRDEMSTWLTTGRHSVQSVRTVSVRLACAAAKRPMNNGRIPRILHDMLTLLTRLLTTIHTPRTAQWRSYLNSSANRHGSWQRKVDSVVLTCMTTLDRRTSHFFTAQCCTCKVFKLTPSTLTPK